ncbi:hypothetical protein AX16_003100 [Volvariella volvacea WC 439]|nr:hypothetical protein AX16_003100 [Volvariella volvacea WC 439]
MDPNSSATPSTTAAGSSNAPTPAPSASNTTSAQSAAGSSAAPTAPTVAATSSTSSAASTAAAGSTAASGSGAATSAAIDHSVLAWINQFVKSQDGSAGSSSSTAPAGAAAMEPHQRQLMIYFANLLKQGKLSQAQILHSLKQITQKGTAGATTLPASTPGASTSTASVQPISVTTTAPTAAAASATPTTTTHPALRAGTEASTPAPSFAWTNPADGYPAIGQNLSYLRDPGPVQWQATRPTLSGGIASGRVSGTPAQIAKNTDDAGSSLNLDDGRSRRKNTPGDQSMRRTIQDLVASVDPNVKIEPEVEDLLLSIADEFIDSVTNFSCRLAKHRGGDTLEVRDLQLHLERNHNIRIPGFASDETRMSLAQSSLMPVMPPAGSKKNPQGTHMTLRSQRLAQVQQAKREAKLM